MAAAKPQPRIRTRRDGGCAPAAADLHMLERRLRGCSRGAAHAGAAAASLQARSCTVGVTVAGLQPRIRTRRGDGCGAAAADPHMLGWRLRGCSRGSAHPGACPADRRGDPARWCVSLRVHSFLRAQALRHLRARGPLATRAKAVPARPHRGASLSARPAARRPGCAPAATRLPAPGPARRAARGRPAAAAPAPARTTPPRSRASRHPRSG